MPKNLTEADTYHATIQVPVGGDSRNDAAGDVERVAQRLADRTHYLNQRTGKLAAGNTWAGANVFDGLVTVREGITLTPDNENASLYFGRAAGGAVYQEIFTAQAGTDNAERVRFYTCINGNTQGALLVVTNAYWVASGPNAGWNQVNTARASTALIMRNADVRVSGKLSGTATPWAEWEATNMNDMQSEMIAEVFRAQRMACAGNTFTDYSNGYRYNSPIARTSPIPLGMCWGNACVNDFGHIIRNPAVTGVMDAVWIPIPVPPFSTFGRVRVQMYQLQSVHLAADQFQLYKRSQHSGWVAQGSVESNATFGSNFTISLHTPGPEQVVLDGDEWAYRWKVVSSDPAAAGNGIIGVSTDWTDYGPQNRVG